MSTDCAITFEPFITRKRLRFGEDGPTFNRGTLLWRSSTVFPDGDFVDQRFIGVEYIDVDGQLVLGFLDCVNFPALAATSSSSSRLTSALLAAGSGPTIEPGGGDDTGLRDDDRGFMETPIDPGDDADPDPDPIITLVGCYRKATPRILKTGELSYATDFVDVPGCSWTPLLGNVTEMEFTWPDSFPDADAIGLNPFGNQPPSKWLAYWHWDQIHQNFPTGTETWRIDGCHSTDSCMWPAFYASDQQFAYSPALEFFPPDIPVFVIPDLGGNIGAGSVVINPFAGTALDTINIACQSLDGQCGDLAAFLTLDQQAARVSHCPAISFRNPVNIGLPQCRMGGMIPLGLTSALGPEPFNTIMTALVMRGTVFTDGSPQIAFAQGQLWYAVRRVESTCNLAPSGPSGEVWTSGNQNAWPVGTWKLTWN